MKRIISFVSVFVIFYAPRLRILLIATIGRFSETPRTWGNSRLRRRLSTLALLFPLLLPPLSGCTYTLHDVREWEAQKDIVSLHRAQHSQFRYPDSYQTRNAALQATTSLVLKSLRDRGVRKVIVRAKEEFPQDHWRWLQIPAREMELLVQSLKNCLLRQAMWTTEPTGLTLTAVRKSVLGKTILTGEFGSNIYGVYSKSRDRVVWLFYVDVGPVKNLLIRGHLKVALALREAANAKNTECVNEN